MQGFISRAARTGVLLSLSFFLFSCGSNKNTSTQPQIGQVVTLALFGAPWCANCSNEFPQIQDEIKKFPREQAERIHLKLYVTTGEQPNDPPTAQDAENYRKKLALEAETEADEWPWKKFRTYVGRTMLLPGAAVLDEKGNVLKAYKSGAGGFVVAEIVDYVKNVTK